jgi:hypothetical protein
MRQILRVLIGAALLAGSAAMAQPPPRIKARLIAFDGKTLTLEPWTEKSAKTPPADNKRFTVAVLPDTQYVTIEPSHFDAFKVGDYAGATASVGRGGRLRAVEVHLYPDRLRGSGEGRLPAPAAGQVILNGTLSAITVPGKSGGALTLHYRGAILTGADRNAVCEGRAPPPALASALSCKADAVIEVASDTPVTALVIGDAGLLAPGAVLTVSMAKNTDGQAVTPGVIIEKPVIVEKAVIAEKPQSPH